MGRSFTVRRYVAADEAAVWRVHPDHQRPGYGRRVLGELEARGGEAGYNRVVLFTNERLTAARRRYETSGHEETGRERDEVTGHAFVHSRETL